MDWQRQIPIPRAMAGVRAEFQSVSCRCGLPLLMLVCCLAVAGCGPSENAADVRGSNAGGGKLQTNGEPIKIVCTTGMVADIVRNVAGPRAVVDQLMGEGVDPHVYNATPDDVNRLSRADVVFYSGLHLEGQMVEIFEKLGRRKPVFAVTSHVAHAQLLSVGENYFDPHVWFSPDIWAECAIAVGRSLQEIDPDHAAEYQQRSDDYANVARALIDEGRTQIETIPPEQRVLVTAHDAFEYFGRSFGIEVRAIQGVSTESEAAVKTINDLVDFIVARRVKAVFVESSVSDRNVRALVEGCAARNHAVVVGGELFSDAMGREGTPEGTWIGMVRHNLSIICDGLRSGNHESSTGSVE